MIAIDADLSRWDGQFRPYAQKRMRAISSRERRHAMLTAAALNSAAMSAAQFSRSVAYVRCVASGPTRRSAVPIKNRSGREQGRRRQPVDGSREGGRRRRGMSAAITECASVLRVASSGNAEPAR